MAGTSYPAMLRTATLVSNELRSLAGVSSSLPILGVL